MKMKLAIFLVFVVFAFSCASKDVGKDSSFDIGVRGKIEMKYRP